MVRHFHQILADAGYGRNPALWMAYGGFKILVEA
jgi:hypothetical protein